MGDLIIVYVMPATPPSVTAVKRQCMEGDEALLARAIEIVSRIRGEGKGERHGGAVIFKIDERTGEGEMVWNTNIPDYGQKWKA